MNHSNNIPSGIIRAGLKYIFKARFVVSVVSSLSIFAILVALFILPMSLLTTSKFPLTTSVAQAQTPNTTVNFQSRILLSSGALVPDGNYHLEFKIYDAQVSGATAQGTCTGSCLWMETRTTGNLVRVVNGYVSVNLGSVTAFGSTIPWSQDLYVTMRVGGMAGAASWDTEMVNPNSTPANSRMKLGAVPLALVANNVRSANRTSASSDNITIQTGDTTTSGTAGNVSLDVGTSVSGTPTISIGANTNSILKTITVGGTTQTGSITLGSSSGAQSVLIGNGTGAASTVSIANATLSGATVNIAGAANTSANAISIANGASAANSTVSILSGVGTAGAGTLNLGNNTRVTTIDIGNIAPAAARTITIGGGANAQTNTVSIANGASAATTTVSILSGVGTAGAGTLNLGNNTRVTTIDIGNIAAAAARTINLGTGSNIVAIDTINLGTGNTTVAGGKTINIGNGTPSGSGTNIISIGSIAALANTTTIQGGNGAGAISIQAAASGTISLGTTNNNVVAINTAAVAGTTTIGGTGTTGTITLGQTSTASNTINIGTVAGGTFTQAINIGTSATASSTTNITLGSTIAGITTIQNAATINLNAGTVLGNTATQNLFNTVATTVNFAGAATTLTAGATTGTTSIRNTLTVGTSSTTSGTLKLLNATNAFGITVSAANQTVGNATILFPDTLGVADTFCLVTKANCSGSATTLKASYDSDGNGSDTRIDLTNVDDSLIFSNPTSNGTTSGFVLKVEQLNTGIATDALTVSNSGTGDILELQDSGTAVLRVTDGGNITANNSATGTTGTTEATARTNVTTVTLIAAGAFANNDIIFINNAGQDYYTRITAGGGTTTLTVSPAVSYDVSAAVTKYLAQNIGATTTDYTTLTNRFFQGYFLGGVVTGAGSTTLSDQNLKSTGALTVSGASGTNVKAGGTTAGSAGNSSLFFVDSTGVQQGRFDMADPGLTAASTFTFYRNLTINTVASTLSSTSASGQAVVNVASTAGFYTGDTVLVIQMTGTGAGQSQEATVLSTGSGIVTLTTNLSNTYTVAAGSVAQIVKYNTYDNVTIDAGVTVTAPAWDGAKGGILYFKATGTVTNNGTIDMAGKGFRGGSGPTGGAGGVGGTSGSTTGGTGSAGSAGASGEGPTAGTSATGGGAAGNGGVGGTLTVNNAGNGGGGGGGMGGGGAGGAYATANAGTAGVSAAGGQGGQGYASGGTRGAGGTGGAGTAGAAASTYGAANLSNALYMGGGGASGASGAGGGGGGYSSASGLTNGGAGGAGGSGSAGGNGGGIIYIYANELNNAGTIASDGTAGAAIGTAGSGNPGIRPTGYAGSGGGGAAGATGGGGAGGTIWVKAPVVSVGTVSAVGGAAGVNTGVGGAGFCGTVDTFGGGGGGGAGITGGANSTCNYGSSVAGTSAGSGSAGGAGGSGRIKCDNSAANCNGGNPAVGSTATISTGPATPTPTAVGGLYTTNLSPASGTALYFVDASGVQKGRFETADPALLTSLSAASNTTLNSTASTLSATSSSGQAIVNAASTTGFYPDDTVLIIQMTGTGAGLSEEATVLYAGGTTITLTTNLSNTYTVAAGSVAQIVKYNTYDNVTIDAGVTVTAPAWDGAKGGILYFKATGTVTNNGTIDMAGKGFRGGTGPTGGAGGVGGTSGSTTGGTGTAGSAGASGEGPTGGTSATGGGAAGNGGVGGTTTSGSLGGNGGGGGGGMGGGGAGGAYATANAGTAGVSAAGGQGGQGYISGGTRGAGGTGGAGTAGAAASTYGAANLSNALYMGGGGASGASGAGGGGGGYGNAINGGAGGVGGSGGAGGNGGGIIYIYANEVNNVGTIANDGGNGSASTGNPGIRPTGYAGSGGGGAAGASGGGGAGGTIWVKAPTVSVGTVSAVGGTAGSNTSVGGAGFCGTVDTFGGGGGGGAGVTGGANAVCAQGSSVAGTSAGSGSAGGAGGSGRIKCDNLAGYCTGGSPAIGSSAAVTTGPTSPAGTTGGLYVTNVHADNIVSSGNLTIVGNTAVNGTLTVNDALTATSTATFNGAVTANAAVTVNASTVLNGNVTIGAQTDSGGTAADWAKISQTAVGTIASGGTASITSATKGIVYNGSLYISSRKTGAAEIYRYDGGTTWTKVTQATAGTFAASGTAAIESSYMTVFNGYLYAATAKANAAEIYRYDGGTTWTKVTQATAGTIAASGTANIDAVSRLIAFKGSLYASTNESGAAEVYRYDGGTTWTKVSHATAGRFEGAGTTAIDGVETMVVYEDTLYVGTSESTKGEVYRYDGGTTWTKVTQATAGTIASGGTASINVVSSAAVYKGSLYIGSGGGTNAEVYRYDGGTTWTKVSQATAGTIAASGTASIIQIPSIQQYGGQMFISTAKTDGTEIYRYDGYTNWTKVSQTTAGTLAAGAAAAIDTSYILGVYDNTMFISSEETSSVELYTFSAREGVSYGLQFSASSNNASGTSILQNTGQILFAAEQQVNAASGTDSTGSFLFSHGISTATGAYDLAEDYPSRDDSLQAGDIVVLDTNERGFVKKSSGTTYDNKAVGIYSTNPALRLSQADAYINGGRAVPIALAGRVPVKVTNENGAIAPGDYITTSSRPGYGMKATGFGQVIGKALEGFDAAEGTVLVFINVSQNVPSAGQILEAMSLSNLTVTDTVTAQKAIVDTLKVTGNLTVGGIANISFLKVSGDLEFGGKITSVGLAPTVQIVSVATGNVINSAEVSAQISGTDVAGIIKLVSQNYAGDPYRLKFIFSNGYEYVPVMSLTPNGREGAVLGGYIEESDLDKVYINFVSTPAPGKTYQFNYQIIQAKTTQVAGATTP